MEENKNFKVLISSDGIRAFMSIAPDPTQKEVQYAELLEMLKDRGVRYGIKRDVLQLISGRYKTGEIIENILVAEGIEPYEGRQPTVEYKFEISSKPKEDESGHTDYREISKILNIQEGQVLAVKQKLKPPRKGIKVTGEEISFLPILDIPVTIGDNIIREESEDTEIFKAACNGALRFENQILKVFPTLDIRQDVDFNVGNIHFKGDVKVGRDVLPDFVVEVSGNILIWGSAIACQLDVGGIVDIRAGIVGKNKGTVKAGKTVSATFAENATITAIGDISIKNGIIGSNVHSDSFVTVDMRRSRVVGSNVRGSKGITICNAGSRFDTGTTLITGIDPVKEEKYFKIKKTLDARWNDAKELEKKYGRAKLESKSFPYTISHALQKDLDKWDFLKKQIKNILQHLKKAEEEMYDYTAVIRVKETLYPRVSLQIGKHKITTSKEYYNVTIHFSEEESKLVIT